MNELTAKWSKKEKELYLTALAFILHMGIKNNQTKNEFLKNKADELGVSVTAIKTPKTNIELIGLLSSIKSIKTKRLIIRDMIMLSISDHDLEDKEISTIYEVGSSIGIDPAKIDDFCLWAAKGLEWQIEGKSLVEEDI